MQRVKKREKREKLFCASMLSDTLYLIYSYTTFII